MYSANNNDNIIIFILINIFQKMLLGGTAVTSGFMVYHFWNLIYSTVKPILFTYKNQIGIYVALSAVINFLLCYRFVLPIDERTKNINKWMLRVSNEMFRNRYIIILFFGYFNTRY